MTWSIRKYKDHAIELFHKHKDYYILALNSLRCPLCNNIAPDYIQLQWNLLDKKSALPAIDRITICPADTELRYYFLYDKGSKKLNRMSTDGVSEVISSEIINLLAEYNFQVKI